MCDFLSGRVVKPTCVMVNGIREGSLRAVLQVVYGLLADEGFSEKGLEANGHGGYAGTCRVEGERGMVHVVIKFVPAGVTGCPQVG